MKILSVQYNAMYTLEYDSLPYIRQFTKFDDHEVPDTVVWYETTEGVAIVLINEDLIQLLEDEFLNILD